MLRFGDTVGGKNGGKLREGGVAALGFFFLSNI